MRLYEIATKYESILDHINDEDGVIDEQALSLFDEQSNLMQDKCIALSSLIKNLDADAVAIKMAKIKMAERELRIIQKIEYLESYLKENMERCGISEIKCPSFVIKIRKNPESVNVFDEESIPDDFKIKVIDWKLDKRKIKETIQQGISIPGAGLKQNTRLEIK